MKLREKFNFPMKSMAVFLNAPLVIELSKEAVPFFSSLHWKINLVMKIAENKEVRIPITSCCKTAYGT